MTEWQVYFESYWNVNEKINFNCISKQNKAAPGLVEAFLQQVPKLYYLSFASRFGDKYLLKLEENAHFRLFYLIGIGF